MSNRNASRQNVAEDGNEVYDDVGKQRVRRSHRKSRGGCGNCKRRRVKCDESKPACDKCTSFAIHCDYLPDIPQPEVVAKPRDDAPQPRRRGRPRTNRHLLDRRIGEGTENPAGESTVYLPTSMSVSTSHVGSLPNGTPWIPLVTPPLQLSSPTPAFIVQLPDLELFHHYITVTSTTLSPDEPIAEFYRHGAVELGFEHPFVLRLLLAFTAFHIASSLLDSPESSWQNYERQGEAHTTAALEDVRSLVSNMNESNCQPLYLAAQMIALGHLGAGPKPGEYLAFGTAGATTWLHLLRGVRSIRSLAKDTLFTGKLAPLGSRQTDETDEVTPRTATREYSYSYERPLSLLRSRVESDAGHQPFHLAELDGLEHCFLMQCEKANNIIFAWLYRASDEFVASLRKKEQISLVIFAHFAVLMKAIEGSWFARGWPGHILEGVRREVEGVYAGWVEWPLQEIEGVGDGVD